MANSRHRETTPGDNFREVTWHGYTIEAERDERGDYILSLRHTTTGEISESVGLTEEDVQYLFSIPEYEGTDPHNRARYEALNGLEGTGLEYLDWIDSLEI